MKIEKIKRITGWLVVATLSISFYVYANDFVLIENDEGEEIVGEYEVSQNLDTDEPAISIEENEEVLISEILDEYELLKDEMDLHPIDPIIPLQNDNILEVSQLEPAELEDADVIGEEELQEDDPESIITVTSIK